MEFDKTRVFTALNADELKIGSKVIVANNLGSLKARVDEYYDNGDDTYIRTIKSIEIEDCEKRFEVSTIVGGYSTVYCGLVYLISEAEPIKCEDLKIGDILSFDETEEFMVLGIRRLEHGTLVYLPGYGWATNENLTNFYKKEQK